MYWKNFCLIDEGCLQFNRRLNTHQCSHTRVWPDIITTTYFTFAGTELLYCLFTNIGEYHFCPVVYSTRFGKVHRNLIITITFIFTTVFNHK